MVCFLVQNWINSWLNFLGSAVIWSRLQRFWWSAAPGPPPGPALRWHGAQSTVTENSILEASHMSYLIIFDHIWSILWKFQEILSQGSFGHIWNRKKYKRGKGIDEDRNRQENTCTEESGWYRVKLDASHIFAAASHRSTFLYSCSLWSFKFSYLDPKYSKSLEFISWVSVNFQFTYKLALVS